MNAGSTKAITHFTHGSRNEMPSANSAVASAAAMPNVSVGVTPSMPKIRPNSIWMPIVPTASMTMPSASAANLNGSFAIPACVSIKRKNIPRVMLVTRNHRYPFLSNTLIFLNRNAKNRHTHAQTNMNGTIVEKEKPAT